MLWRVSVALGKGLKILGKAFAECQIRQRPHDKISAGKAVFAECYFSGTQQRLFRVSTLDKDKNKKIKKKSKIKEKKSFFQEANAHQLEFFASLRSMGFELMTSHSRVPALNHCTTLMTSRSRVPALNHCISVPQILYQIMCKMII